MIPEDVYQIIADLIDSAQLRGVDMVFYVDKMAVDIADSEIPAGDINRKRLEDQISKTSVVLNNNHNLYTVQMTSFVFRLQKYIDDTYPFINNYLSDNNIKLKAVFADISGTVGYPIDPSNLVGSS